MDHTREEWQRDMMRLEEIARDYYLISERAQREGRAIVYQVAMENFNTVLRAKVFLEWLLENYKWKDAPTAVQ